jgi:hypothetical protein
VDVIVGMAALAGVAVIVILFLLYRGSSDRESRELAAGIDEWGDYLVRTYRGHEQTAAIASYVKDAETLAERGYSPAGQSWGDGQWDAVYFLIALILCLVGIGLILLAYMAIIRPDGTLCVTYRLNATASRPTVVNEDPHDRRVRF